MYCVDVPLHAASGLFMFTLPPKRGTTRKQKLIKKGEFLGKIQQRVYQTKLHDMSDFMQHLIDVSLSILMAIFRVNLG